MGWVELISVRGWYIVAFSAFIAFIWLMVMLSDRYTECDDSSNGFNFCIKNGFTAALVLLLITVIVVAASLSAVYYKGSPARYRSILSKYCTKEEFVVKKTDFFDSDNGSSVRISLVNKDNVEYELNCLRSAIMFNRSNCTFDISALSDMDSYFSPEGVPEGIVTLTLYRSNDADSIESTDSADSIKRYKVSKGLYLVEFDVAKVDALNTDILVHLFDNKVDEEFNGSLDLKSTVDSKKSSYVFDISGIKTEADFIDGLKGLEKSGSEISGSDFTYGLTCLADNVPVYKAVRLRSFRNLLTSLQGYVYNFDDMSIDNIDYVLSKIVGE